MSIYADTSLLVSLYLTDRHSAEAGRRIGSNPTLWLTPLHVAEWTHAVEQHVFTRLLSRGEADRLHERFQKHRASGLWRETALPDQALDLCAQLGRRHAARLGIRTLGALHVACALELRAERFWTFDDRQRRLAKAEGLATS